ncbi:MAG: DNA repair protein RecO [Desulfomonile tiedjei]|nr:DNA repair protein RecO [Desulfomonile tiedjei]
MVRSLILKKQDWGEADELVVFFSRDLGWLRGVAKNAKKSRVRFGGHLEPFSMVDFTLRPRKKDDLVWIDESQAVHGFLGIRSDIHKVALASYFLELASVFLPEDQPDQEIFDFMLNFLGSLESDDLSPLLLLLDEIRLLGMLGYGPRFDVCPECGRPLARGEDAIFSPARGGACHPGCIGIDEDRSLLLSPDTLAVIRKGLQVERPVAKRLRLSKNGIAELRQALSSFVRHLRGQEINSLVFLEEL